MKRFFASLVLALPAFSPLVGSAHPIDDNEAECFSQAYTTHKQIRCATMSELAWDSLLNSSYNDLRSGMPEPHQSALKTAQLAWLRFLDADANFSNMVFHEILQGTMWQSIAISYHSNAIRDRVMDLNTYDRNNSSEQIEIERDLNYTPTNLDLELKTCLSNAMNTLETRMCLADSARKWDVALNSTYSQLRQLLPANAFSILKVAQKEWITYRDAELKFSADYNSSLGGSGHHLIHDQRVLDVTRSRVKQLTHLFNQLEGM